MYVVPEPREGGPLRLDPPNEEESRRKAGARARCKVRRYCRHNDLTRLWTLTYAEPPESRQQVMRDAAEFARKLRREFGNMPYVLVPERGSKGRLHLHMAFGRWLSKERISALWGHGYVDARRLGPDNQAADRVAGYVSKYVAKSFDDAELVEGHDRAKGEHRYEVAQGFQPVPLEGEAETIAELLELAIGIMGTDPSSAWCSSSREDWYGPPVWLLTWEAV